VNDLSGGSPHLAWLAVALALAVAYRSGVAILIAAFHGLPSIQRRRLLEEGAVPDPGLAALLADPQLLGLGLGLWNQALLLLVLGLAWPCRAVLPGGGWTLGALVLVYLWVMDLALPTLLSSPDPATWIQRLFPLYAPAHPLLLPFIAPLARRLAREEQESRREGEDQEVSDDAVTALLEEGEAEGILEAEDRELIRNVVTFGDTVVREVMTPRTRIVALPATATVEEAWNAFRESRHSRLPVYEGTIDHVEGILLLKDLMQHRRDRPVEVRSLLKAPFFVPESKPVADLLREMQRARIQLAIVVDEFGGMSGVVTLEDLLEEVFGEIRDEHEGPGEVVETGSGVFEVSGQIHVEDLAERLGLAWERDGFDTLGGLVMARLGRVPVPGDEVEVEGARLRVLQMDGARILQVRVEVI
jgi:putative hemolysin